MDARREHEDRKRDREGGPDERHRIRITCGADVDNERGIAIASERVALAVSANRSATHAHEESRPFSGSLAHMACHLATVQSIVRGSHVFRRAFGLDDTGLLGMK
jgi:hypothetical protein